MTLPEIMYVADNNIMIVPEGEKEYTAMSVPFNIPLIARDATKYTRADLIPQWRPIEEWDGQRPYHCAFSQAFDDGVWVVVPEGHPCTHFMQLTPPERRHD